MYAFIHTIMAQEEGYKCTYSDVYIYHTCICSKKGCEKENYVNIHIYTYIYVYIYI